MLKKVKLFAIVLSGLFMLAGAGAVRADDWCTKQIRHEQHELDRAIARHGFYSRQADHERRELDRLRDQCRYRDYNRFR